MNERDEERSVGREVGPPLEGAGLDPLAVLEGVRVGSPEARPCPHTRAPAQDDAEADIAGQVTNSRQGGPGAFTAGSSACHARGASLTQGGLLLRAEPDRNAAMSWTSGDAAWRRATWISPSFPTGDCREWRIAEPAGGANFSIHQGGPCAAGSRTSRLRRRGYARAGRWGMGEGW